MRELETVSRAREMGRAFLDRTWRAELYQRAFGTGDGQRVLADILDAAGILKNSQVDGDAYRTAYNEGRRSIALEILELLRWNALDVMKLSQARQSSTLEEG